MKTRTAWDASGSEPIVAVELVAKDLGKMGRWYAGRVDAITGETGDASATMARAGEENGVGEDVVNVRTAVVRVEKSKTWGPGLLKPKSLEEIREAIGMRL